MNIQEQFISDLLAAQQDYAAQTIERIKKENLNVYVFGAGVAGGLVQKTLKQYDIHIKNFVDNNPEKSNSYIDGVSIINFEQLKSEPSPKLILIGTVAFHHEIVNQCLAGGILENEISTADFVHYHEQKQTRKYFFDHVPEIVDIYSHCVDDESRQLFITNLLFQFHRNRALYSAPFSPLSQQYYEPSFIQFNNESVFFDCGAKDGDTALGFVKASNEHYKSIFSFEPDCSNFQLLEHNISKYPEIHPINAGVGEAEAVLHFNGNKGGHSSFDDAGELSARIVPLDNYFHEHPTLIKMDIEGFELNALKGAKKILSELHPQLAICVYHKPCDLVELPSYILSQNPNYKIHFKLYRDFGHDFVCYCV